MREGTDLLEQAWAKVPKQPGLPVNRLASISANLGRAYEQAGQLAKAESLYHEALETVRQRHEEASPSATYLQVLLAGNLLMRQEIRRGRVTAPRVPEVPRTERSEQVVDLATKSKLGGSLLGQNKYAEAEPLLLAGYEGLKQREETIPPIVRKPRLTEAIERLVRLYEATGNADKAGEWRRSWP